MKCMSTPVFYLPSCQLLILILFCCWIIFHHFCWKALNLFALKKRHIVHQSVKKRKFAMRLFASAPGRHSNTHGPPLAEVTTQQHRRWHAAPFALRKPVWLVPSKSIFPSLFVSDSPNISSMSSSVTGSPVRWRMSPNSSRSMNPSPFLQNKTNKHTGRNIKTCLIFILCFFTSTPVPHILYIPAATNESSWLQGGFFLMFWFRVSVFLPVYFFHVHSLCWNTFV